MFFSKGKDLLALNAVMFDKRVKKRVSVMLKFCGFCSRALIRGIVMVVGGDIKKNIYLYNI